MEDKDKEKEKLEEKKEQWESFVKKAKVKTANHTTMVRFYNAIYNMMILSVILLAGILTCAILLGGIGKMVLAALSATCTILTATSKFIVADRKKAGHKRFFKLFQTLLIRMLRCETVAEYNILWHELHEAIIKEPLVLIWRRRSKKISVNFAMAPRLVLAFEGKEEPVPSNVMPQHGYRDGYRASINNRPGEFNPHDFHVMSIDERSQNQQVPNRRDAYVAISGFEEQKMKTPRKGTTAEKIPGEKTSMTASQSKSKRKKSKADSEKSFQSRQPHSGFSSSATLDEIEEEQELEEQQNIPETSDSVALTERTAKKKKGQNGQNHQTKSSVQDLPPPPPLEEDEDEYIEQESKQANTTKLNPTSSKNFRATTSRSDHRSIVYNEEEENELSEDSDELDENEDMTSYTRN